MSLNYLDGFIIRQPTLSLPTPSPSIILCLVGDWKLISQQKSVCWGFWLALKALCFFGEGSSSAFCHPQKTKSSSFWADSTTKQRRGGGAAEAREEIKILRCLQPQPVNIEPYTEMCLGENSKLISHFSVIVRCTDHYSGRQIRRGEYPSNPEVDPHQRCKKRHWSICAKFYAFADPQQRIQLFQTLQCIGTVDASESSITFWKWTPWWCTQLMKTMTMMWEMRMVMVMVMF